MDPLKYLFEKPALSGRLSRRLILLAEFVLKYMARKTIKGSVMSNFCAENPIEGGGGTVKRIFRMRIFWMLSWGHGRCTLTELQTNMEMG